LKKWAGLISLLLTAFSTLIVGIVTNTVELVLSSFFATAVGIVWEFVHVRNIDASDITERLQPSRRALRIAGIVFGVFAGATTWGVYRKIIPFELVMTMLCFAAAAPVVAAPYLYFYRRTLAKSKAADNWPLAPGRVKNSVMEETVSVWPAAIVIYVYEVNGKQYRGTRVRFGGTGAMHPAAAQQVLAMYPIGATVSVYYDPERPGQSVLIPGGATPDKRLLWGAGMSAGAVMIGATMMALFVVLGLIDAGLTAIVGHRVLP
jgi:hypothetical protein